MTTIKVYANDDTYAKEDVPSGRYGTDTTIYIRTYSPKSLYAFIKWDFSDIPADAEISAATLYVYCKTVSGGGCPDVQMYRCDTDWFESSLNWNNKPGITGDLIHTFNFIKVGNKNDGGAILPIVKGWFDKSIANYGIRLKEKNELDAYCTFYSNETGYLVDAYIEVTYTIPVHRTEGIANVSGKGSLNINGSKRVSNIVQVSGAGSVIVKLPYLELNAILSSEERVKKLSVLERPADISSEERIKTLSVQERPADVDIQEREVILGVDK